MTDELRKMKSREGRIIIGMREGRKKTHFLPGESRDKEA